MKIQEILNYISRTLETVSSVSVRAIKSHTFSVNVKNHKKVQEVKGTVIVGNQKHLENEIKSLKKGLDSLTRLIDGKKYPETIKISNVSDFPKPIEPKEVIIPETVTISNPQTKIEITNIKEIEKYIAKLEKTVKAIKLDPKIDVKPQITVEPTKVNIPEIIIPESEKLLSDNPKQYIPVRLTDGEEFYNAISNIIGGIKRSLNEVKFSDYEVNKIFDIGTTTYFFLETKTASWCVKRINEDNEFEYATIVNNPTVITYESATTEYDSLVYGRFSEAF